MPHEFLYLVYNSWDRLKLIEENHKMDLEPNKLTIFHWEIDEHGPSTALTSSIYLLGGRAFENNGPEQLINDQFKVMSEGLTLKHNAYGGELPESSSLVSLTKQGYKDYERIRNSPYTVGKSVSNPPNLVCPLDMTTEDARLLSMSAAIASAG